MSNQTTKLTSTQILAAKMVAHRYHLALSKASVFTVNEMEHHLDAIENLIDKHFPTARDQILARHAIKRASWAMRGAARAQPNQEMAS